MYKGLFGVLAACIVTSQAGAATPSNQPLNERIESAQEKLRTLLEADRASAGKMAQHHRDFRDWHNIRNHHHN